MRFDRTQSLVRRLRAGGGFTLVELLIVIALLGLLAMIALPVFDPKPRVYLIVMQHDLKNLIGVQEVYYMEHGKYANSVSVLNASVSPNVTMVIVGDAQGWTARTQHTIRTDYRCAMYMGNANPIFAPAQEEGTIACLPKKKTGQTKKKNQPTK